MKTIGIVAEYNPFHNGHIYQIEKIKEKYPDSLLVVVLNGNFTQRGEPSILTKEDKTKIALKHNIDLVIELPILCGTQSADKFAEASILLLDALKIETIIFGSESNDLVYLEKLALKQLKENFQINQEKNLSFPARLNKSLEENTKICPNDLLGIAYIKAILKHQLPIQYELIQRTNDYHDLTSNEKIISASNIRNKWQRQENVESFVPNNSSQFYKNIDYSLLFQLLKTNILTNSHLDEIIDVKEGLDYKLKKEILNTTDYFSFIESLKSKRYTYNLLRRMLCHILLGLKKEDSDIPISYLHILGFNERGQAYLKQQKKKIKLPTTPIRQSKLYLYEQTAALIYDMLTKSNTYSFELQNKPCFYTPTSDNDFNQK